MRSFHEKGGFAFTSLLAATSGFCVMRSIVFLPMILVCCYARAQENQTTGKFTLNGKVIGCDTGRISISYPNKIGQWFDDTAYLKNGHFSFKGTIDGPTHTYLFNNIQAETGNIPEVFLEPGTVNILLSTNDFNDPKITGSHTQDELDILNTQKKATHRKLEALDHVLTGLREAKNKGDTSKSVTNKIQEVEKKMMYYTNRLMQADFAFVRQHPGSYLSPYLLGAYTSKQPVMDSLRVLYKSLGPEIQNSLYGQDVYAHLRNKELAIIKIGDAAPGFIKTDMNDREISLSSFKGKSYVLLDFWASWCGECLAITPHIKGLYQKYHRSGLEVIGITCDYNKAPWKTAVAKEGISQWYQVFPTTDKQMGGNDLQEAYGLTFIPALFLVDMNGRIAGIYKGSNSIKELDTKLAEVFR